MQRKCLKCGHGNNDATGAELEPCPSCGAIYSRVEAAWRKDGPPSLRAPLDRSPAPDLDVKAFATTMRQDSLYPNFRGLVRVFYWFWMVLAVACFLGTVLAFIGAGFSLPGLFGGLFGTLLFVLIAKVSTEVSLMFADLSDAAVRTAARQDASA